ncbi:FkbM family methyltransferase [Algoriphagus sp.]|uniref:FkbM family methyltransferase n=1 Tax=Algoriphagus sp. TaxID=1872435 RepID=UPI00341765A4
MDLLKIDTEGFDLKVLHVAQNMLVNGSIKLVYIECGLDPSIDYHVFFQIFFRN